MDTSAATYHTYRSRGLRIDLTHPQARRTDTIRRSQRLTTGPWSGCRPAPRGTASPRSSPDCGGTRRTYMVWGAHARTRQSTKRRRGHIRCGSGESGFRSRKARPLHGGVRHAAFVDKHASLPGIDMVRLRHEQSYMYPFHRNGARPFPAGRYHAEIVGAHKAGRPHILAIRDV